MQIPLCTWRRRLQRMNYTALRFSKASKWECLSASLWAELSLSTVVKESPTTASAPVTTTGTSCVYPQILLAIMLFQCCINVCYVLIKTFYLLTYCQHCHRDADNDRIQPKWSSVSQSYNVQCSFCLQTLSCSLDFTGFNFGALY